jgi:hypothetical protein
MAAMLCDIVQEYTVPPGVTAFRIEVESSGSGEHSSSAVTLNVRPGATVRLRLACLPAQQSSEDSAPPSRPKSKHDPHQ